MKRGWRWSLLVVLGACVSAGRAGAAEVTIEVRDAASGEAVPCRIHCQNAAGEPVLNPRLPSFRDHFVCPGTATLDVPPGTYTYEIERGPEYSAATGQFEVSAGENNRLSAELSRLADLAAEGWWSGELHVHRDVDDIELLMRAEDLHVAPVITWWNNRNLWKERSIPERLLVRFDGDRFYHLMAGEDEREGGALLYFNLQRPLDITGAGREYPSPMTFLEKADRHEGVWVDIEKPFWWDVPTWLASGKVDSIGLANNHMCRSQMYESEAWGKPRDADQLPPPLGNGLWTQQLYYKILDTGMRIPPSAGSASGVLPNPVGYNRVYVHVDGELTYEKWWDGLKAGRSFVTNGPLLQVTANGELPGHVFSSPSGEPFAIELAASITGRDDIAAIEIVQNGRVVQSVNTDGTSYRGTLPKIVFERSGWCLLRVRCKNLRTFRFASTAPFYVEIGDKPRRTSRSAAQFFLDWVNERAGRVKLDDPQQRQDVLKYHAAAREFWQQRVNAANAD